MRDLSRTAAQTVKMSLVLQVFRHRELDVDASRLKHDANLLPDAIRLRSHVETLNARVAAGGHHQRGKYAKQRGFSAAIWPEQAKDLGLSHLERKVIECQAASVVVSEPIQLDWRRSTA